MISVLIFFEKSEAIKAIYSHLKPVIPRRLQISLRRSVALQKRSLISDSWPIDKKAHRLPEGFSGWPGDKRFALVLTHDVESSRGQEKCIRVAKLEENLGFRSSFNFVPEEYSISYELLEYLRNHGFEVGVHGLRHRGNLFGSRKSFQKQAARINLILKQWNAVGFRTPGMYHNFEWTHELNIEYDASSFDSDPFEPQPDGVGTIFPFLVPGKAGRRGYVELPYTLPQDFALFVLMLEKGIQIWKHKLHWIAEHGGMALLITHPDYMNYEDRKTSFGEYQAGYYREFLEYITDRYEGQYWNVLPRDMARFWINSLANNEG
jgi:hypothetical protein